MRERAAASAEAAAARNAQSGRGDEYSGVPSSGDADVLGVEEPQVASVIVASAARLPKVGYPRLIGVFCCALGLKDAPDDAPTSSSSGLAAG